ILALFPTVRWLNGDGPVKPAAYRPLDPIKQLFSIRGMPTILLTSISFNGMQWCLRSFFTIYLVSHLRFSLVAAGVAFSASQAAGAGGQGRRGAPPARGWGLLVVAVTGVRLFSAACFAPCITSCAAPRAAPA